MIVEEPESKDSAEKVQYSEKIFFRTSPIMADKYERAASQSGLKLSDWLRRVADAAAIEALKS